MIRVVPELRAAGGKPSAELPSLHRTSKRRSNLVKIGKGCMSSDQFMEQRFDFEPQTEVEPLIFAK